MFNCEICKKTSEPGETQHKVVVATRMHNHPSREEAYTKRLTLTGEKVRRDDPGGRGTQIVREINACSGCASGSKHAPTYVGLNSVKHAILVVDQNGLVQ